jgi:hydroxymethylpyrimidine pyrophosphatase-like HAD family hydrolase
MLVFLILFVCLQKVVFTDTPEQITNVIRPYWSREMENIARVVQAQEQFLEIIPAGTSKGNGVSLLLDHMGVHPDDV